MKETIELMQKAKKNDVEYSKLLLRILLMIDGNSETKNISQKN